MNLLLSSFCCRWRAFWSRWRFRAPRPQASRVWALAVSLARSSLSLGLLAWFDRGLAGEQFAHRRAVDLLARYPFRHFASTASASGWCCSPPC